MSATDDADRGKLGRWKSGEDGLARDSEKKGKAAATRAEAALKAAFRRIESEPVPEAQEDHARRVSGAPPKGDKRN